MPKISTPISKEKGKSKHQTKGNDALKYLGCEPKHKTHLQVAPWTQY
jgi:hypothetical protein